MKHPSDVPAYVDRVEFPVTVTERKGAIVIYISKAQFRKLVGFLFEVNKDES